MRQRELQRCGPQRHAVGLAQSLDAGRSLHPLGGSWRIVEDWHGGLAGALDFRANRASHTRRQNPRIEHASQRNAHSPLRTQRQQLRQRTLVQQAIAARQHQHVDVGLLKHLQHHGHIVGAKANLAHHAFALHRGQSRQRLVDDLAKHCWRTYAVCSRVRVVHVGRVQPRHAQPLQAVFHTAPGAGLAVIPDLVERRQVHVAVLLARSLRLGQQQPPHLAGQRETVARVRPQRVAKAPLRQAVAVVRRRVKASAALRPRSIHQRPCPGVADG